MKLRLVIAATLGLSAGPAFADDRLVILHTNDFHARFEPVDRFGAACTEEGRAAGRCYGGAARLTTAIRAARQRFANTVLLDGGDQFQGSLFYTVHKGGLAAEMMNRLGYDAMAVGNHEFDDGPAALRDFVNAAKFPVLSVNVDVGNAPQLDGLLRKSAVIMRGGRRIGLIGLTPEDTAGSSSPGPGVTFGDPVAAVRAEVDRLTAAGVKRIVVLSHSGYEIDKRIARETSGVDVIVGGHSHTPLGEDVPWSAGPYPTMVGDTAVVQAYAYGVFLGVLSVAFDAAGRVTAASGGPVLLDSTVAADAAVQARIEQAAQPLKEVRGRVVAEAAAPVAGGALACRSGECQMGTLVADAMLDRVRGQGIDVALQNGGGLTRTGGSGWSRTRMRPRWCWLPPPASAGLLPRCARRTCGRCRGHRPRSCMTCRARRLP
ncbi:metallophosphoesterase [Roseovarius salis]|uniref:metallophosphoesterase n=1 Tax=Roseovarius salis TaxID=3376063 RepID=UPI0037C5C1C0